MAQVKASEVWLAQPETEKGRTDKLCACCQQNSGTKSCSKCCCTMYCSRDCQIKHWKDCHKKYCKPDPLYTLEAPLPTCRDYTEAELNDKRISFTIMPGDIMRTDVRHALCEIVMETDASFDKELLEIHTKHGGFSPAVLKDSDLPTAETLSSLGWKGMGTEPMTGFDAEDRVIYRIFYDDNYSQREDMELNDFARTVVNNPYTRGKFVVIKHEAYDHEMDPETGGAIEKAGEPIPFSKAELVELMQWRMFCSRFNMVSSRVFRQDMNKLEMKYFMSNMGLNFMNI